MIRQPNVNLTDYKPRLSATTQISLRWQCLLAASAAGVQTSSIQVAFVLDAAGIPAKNRSTSWRFQWPVLEDSDSGEARCICWRRGGREEVTQTLVDLGRIKSEWTSWRFVVSASSKSKGLLIGRLSPYRCRSSFTPRNGHAPHIFALF